MVHLYLPDNCQEIETAGALLTAAEFASASFTTPWAAACVADSRGQLSHKHLRVANLPPLPLHAQQLWHTLP